jgi:hypothetical protein
VSLPPSLWWADIVPRFVLYHISITHQFLCTVRAYKHSTIGPFATPQPTMAPVGTILRPMSDERYGTFDYLQVGRLFSDLILWSSPLASRSSKATAARPQSSFAAHVLALRSPASRRRSIREFTSRNVCTPRCRFVTRGLNR